MASQKISWADKSNYESRPDVPVNQKMSGPDANDIKNTVGSHADDIDTNAAAIVTGATGAGVSLDITTFNNNLSASDNTTQKAMETLDNLVIGAGSGDMTKAVYDTGNNGIVDDSDKLGGALPSVYNQSATTPILNSNDWWEMQSTAAGHTIDVGQETFIPCVNTSSTNVTALNPKLFVLGKAAAAPDSEFINSTLASASDLSDVLLFGINTTAADAGGKTDIIIFGNINNLDTSAWSAGDILYADTIRGGLTNVVPSQDIYPVGRVEISHATTGALFVFSIRSSEIEILGKAVGVQRTWFTGDELTTAEDTFYLALTEDRGTVASAPQSIVVADNTTVKAAQDLLGGIRTVTTTFQEGTYNAVIDYTSNSSDAFDKVSIEYYLADGEGVISDSGSGLPNGIYPFPPIATLESALVDSVAGARELITLSGRIDSALTVGIGSRIRIAVLFTKEGATGGNTTFTLYYGNTHLSFADAPQQVVIGSLGDVEDDGIEGDILRKGSDFIWRPLSGNVDITMSISTLADIASYSSLATGDLLQWNGTSGFWENGVNPAFLKTDHISAFTGITGEPVITGVGGKISGALVEVAAVVFKGDFTPTAGSEATEYPDKTGLNEGDTYIMTSIDGGYALTTGDLSGLTVYNSSWMQMQSGLWVSLNNNVQAQQFPNLIGKTGNTITFDDYNEYNAVAPATSGDITIDPTGAVVGAYVNFYFNGATEPVVSGATVQLTTGTFVASQLNIYNFHWNNAGQVVLNIQN